MMYLINQILAVKMNEFAKKLILFMYSFGKKSFFNKDNSSLSLYTVCCMNTMVNGKTHDHIFVTLLWYIAST